jgi:leader peptidase (prepilin peptidase)/N-methyltransferase
LPHIPFLIFFFLIGACVGSFLNVVVWRVPRGESIVSPPSHCPKCNTRLALFTDNLPILGWIALRGKCRYCGQPISARYPIIEFITAALFALCYVTMFIFQEGPCHSELRDLTIRQDWPLYVLYIFMIGGLLACSLIDAEYYIVPIEIAWIFGGLGLLVHAFIDMPITPGALNATPPVAAVALGSGVGLLLSLFLLDRNILKRSFNEGAPLLEIEKKAVAEQGGNPDEIVFTPGQVRWEILKEVLFLTPPLLLGAVWLLLTLKVPFITRVWQSALSYYWVSGLLGALWGGLFGAFLIWFIMRICGSMIFGREALGLGDVHLMLGIGAVIGAAGSTLVFFIAPFVGLLFALYRLIARKGREVPYVPYLSVAALVVVLFYCRLIHRFEPSMHGLALLLQQLTSGN